MKVLLRLALYSLVALLVMLCMTHLGDVWERRANPIAGVSVGLDGGQVLRGTLSREWDGRYTVTSPRGRVTVFRLDQVDSLVIPPAPDDPDSFGPAPSAAHSALSIDWARWRVFTPLYASIALMAALIFFFDRPWLRALAGMAPARNAHEEERAGEHDWGAETSFATLGGTGASETGRLPAEKSMTTKRRKVPHAL